MLEQSYIIDGGVPGAERLAVVARLLAPTSEVLLRRTGIREDSRCLDLGCGSGELTRRMAELAGTGEVIGVDLDPEVIDIARKRTGAPPAPRFMCGDCADLPRELRGQFDVIYARLLLAHVPDPASTLRGLRALCRPGGTIAVEDIDVAAAFCYPECEALDSLNELYRRAAEVRGGDARIGPRLPELVEQAGFERVELWTVQPTYRDGEGKYMMELSFRATRDAVLTSALATEERYAGLVDQLHWFGLQPGTLISLPRIFQVVAVCPD